MSRLKLRFLELLVNGSEYLYPNSGIRASQHAKRSLKVVFRLQTYFELNASDWTNDPGRRGTTNFYVNGVVY
jgi:hypothetical protein